MASIVVSKASRSMRIIALPLTRAKPSAPNTSLQVPSLIYYHFQITSKGSGNRSGILNWVTTKTAVMWANLGKSKEGSFKVRPRCQDDCLLVLMLASVSNFFQLRIYRYGVRLIDRIDFEELALKSIDPSLAPKLSSPDFRGNRHEDNASGGAQLVVGTF
jgi:hypothetical protein